ncbi:hypothetical protein EDB81DRAFT_770768 [Dactylonectria macrodidyma]|uniref:Uncharacterized protein n=1 Tax=Dactylonectria macrodidyma TaxID=307937 RepID=A0A9P9FUS4_9HYPO|nr:hypothetical protein EDB81DRAFT_770768 [Dactylonectria macrodidyma]
MTGEESSRTQGEVEHVSRVVKVPTKIEFETRVRVYFAGSAQEQGAVDWRQSLMASLADEDVVFYDPTRDNQPGRGDLVGNHVVEQAQWEMDCLRMTDIAVFFFNGDTESSTVLLQLGMAVEACSSPLQRVVVCVEPEYAEAVYVRMFCNTNRFEYVTELSALHPALSTAIEECAFNAYKDGVVMWWREPCCARQRERREKLGLTSTA